MPKYIESCVRPLPVLLLVLCTVNLSHTAKWKLKEYPTRDDTTCGPYMKYNYLCDPDKLLTALESKKLATQLTAVSNGTKCQCERQKQCRLNALDHETKVVSRIRIGFIVGIALAESLHNESRKVAQDMAGRISKVWSLGDCGNSALIFYVEQLNRLTIVTPNDRVAQTFLTAEDGDRIISEVQHYFPDRKAEGLEALLEKIKAEFNGEAEKATDIGTLFLILSISIACIVVCIIAGCVFAFRCCGNINTDADSAIGKTLSRVDSIKSEVIRRGSMLRRSFSRSPKFPHRPVDPNNEGTGLNGMDGYPGSGSSQINLPGYSMV